LEEKISARVLDIDRRIRFAGVVTNRGEVIEGGFQQQVEPLLDQKREQQLYLDSLSAIGSLKEFSDTLGDVVYNITEYKKVILMTIPLKESKILCISVSPDVDITNLKNEVFRLIGPRN
jgi:hypothetical protein